MLRKLGFGSKNKARKPIKIGIQCCVSSVVFLPDGKHFVSADWKGMIQRWQVEDGQEVGMPMNAGSWVSDIAASADGNLLVSGTNDGNLGVWNVQSHEKVREFKGHDSPVRAVDVSPDGTKIASGSFDNTVSVWSLSTGERLLGPLEHGEAVNVAKFSPDGRLLATATWVVRIYDSQDGRLLFDAPSPIEVNWQFKQSLAWASDSRRLFALSRHGPVHCLDASVGLKALSTWDIHASCPRSVVLSKNGAFVAVSVGSSVSFWDTVTHQKIGPVIKHPIAIDHMAISENYDIVLVGWMKVTLQSLRGIIPSYYTESVVVPVQASVV